jgi:transposase
MLKEAGGIRRVVLKTGRTDLRRGIDGLKAIISLNGMDPLEKGTLFLFCGRRNDRIRGLIFEGDGFLLITKRLSGQNRFQWPRNEEDMKNITMEQYRNLMEGFTIEGSIREL